MKPDEIKKRIIAVVEHCRKLTLSLVRLSKDQKQVEGIASGFLIKVGDTTYLISAGHALEKNGWAIETTFTIENECLTACIPLGGPWTLKRLTIGDSKLQEVDIAWAKVDIAAFQKAVSGDGRLKGKEFECMLYHGTLEDAPGPKELYVYASQNRGTIVSALGKTFLERDVSYEYEMKFKGIRKDGLYTFSIPKHKGHTYYEGASGSPIIEPSGKVVAVLVQGSEKKNELYAFPTRGIIELVRIAADVEQRGAARNKK